MPELHNDPNVNLQSNPDAEESPLEERIRQLAHKHEDHFSRRRGRRPTLLELLEEEETGLEKVYKSFGQASEEDLALSYAAEWILDNFHIIQQAIRQIGEDMPLGYYRQLPKLDATHLEGYPRVYALAREIIVVSDAHLDLDAIETLVQNYQEISPLAMGEVWALPTMLRLGILELLTQAVARITEGELEREIPFPRVTLSDKLQEDAIVANCVLSLRMLATQEWKEFFERVSCVDDVLRSDPAGVYERMDFKTRDRYRGVVEELALALEKREDEVAQEAIALARSDVKGFPRYPKERMRHVGFFLLGAGRERLEKRLDYRPPLDKRVAHWLVKHPTLVYLGSIGILTLLLVLGLVGYARTAGGAPWQLAGVALLSLIPMVTISVDLVNNFITRTVPPNVLPKMDFEEGIPEAYRTMVVVPSMLTSEEEVESLLHQLELHYLSTRDPYVTFALLTDFADAPEKEMPGEAEYLELAQAGIRALNRKYRRDTPGPFYLFHRERRWNPGEEVWMGWERKRGKLTEFNHLILGEGETSYVVQLGDLEIVPEIRYVITLDADTTLPRGSAHKLVATLAHPLNHALFEPERDEVFAGYTVLQPRVEIQPTSAEQTRFTQIFTGDSGLDLYTRAVSDVYQDLFGEGSYIGKGIYDVAAFERSLRGRVPENSLLSHDLFEGMHGRAALVTDVTFYEDYPPHYLVHIRRMHRWVRGDWQLLPWLWPRVPAEGGGTLSNRLSTIDVWKIVDNLRRSLVQPALVLFFVAGWILFPGSPWLWTLVGGLTLGIPFFTSLVTSLVQEVSNGFQRLPSTSLKYALLRWLLTLAFLPYEALLLLDAIGVTLIRVFFTRKRLLQWVTAAHTLRIFGREHKLALMWQQMREAVLLTLLFAFLVAFFAPLVLPAALPLLIAWVLSPQIAHWISQPLQLAPPELSTEQRQVLRRLARRTWLYFEHFVGPEDHWLPPDHFQEEPKGLAAHRTSPTNIGLMLLSTLAAYDMGYLSLFDLTLRLRTTLESLGQLERYRGHFLNWYDTRSREPLAPRYVSTVDSGNLAGSLIAFEQGCLDLIRVRPLRWSRWQGLADVLSVLLELLKETQVKGALVDHLRDLHAMVLEVEEEPERWASFLVRLDEEEAPQLDDELLWMLENAGQDLGAETLRSIRVWVQRIHHHLDSHRREVEFLLPWLALLEAPPQFFVEAEGRMAERWEALRAALPPNITLDAIPEHGREAQEQVAALRDLLPEGEEDALPESVRAAYAWCDRMDDALMSARMNARGLRIACQDLSEQAARFNRAMDFGFLMDPYRLVFHIGYNVDSGRLDANYYDLLASEARLASLIAIAKGDVSQSHWLHMSRPFTQVDSQQALVSWSGTMFEYLMPLLLTRDYPQTLLGRSCRAAVEAQMDYAREQGTPWGISESGYYNFDAAQNYQYKAFGVPGLGFKRGLGDELVITPYASLLALPLRPQEVMQNVDRLTREEMLGRYGFYEAIDYTPSHLPLGKKSGIVKSYMAHHQGMIMLALLNYLENDVMIERFHADPFIQSVALLLQEQVPGYTPIERTPTGEVSATRPEKPKETRYLAWEVPTDAPLPLVHSLSNGSYGLIISNSGSGYSWWNDLALTRWRADTTLDAWGTWIYVQDLDRDMLWSLGKQPTVVPPEQTTIRFAPHEAEYRRRDDNVSSHMRVVVAPDDDVEIRMIDVTNHDDKICHLRLTSYAEVVLAPLAADRRHPAFNKLFVESEYLSEVNGLLFRRRPRQIDEEPIFLLHALVVDQNTEPTGAHESDRARFLGRGGSYRAPLALVDRDRWLPGTTGATLDPVMALGQELELEPHASVRLAFITMAGSSRQEVLELARRYKAWPKLNRTFDQAQSQRELELHQLKFGPTELQNVQRLLSTMYYPYPALRAPAETIAANTKGQPGLWGFGISGDYPILLVRVSSQDEGTLLRALLRAHAYWRNRQIKIDMVFLNEKESGYNQELQSYLHRLLAQTDSDTWLNRRGGIFLVRTDQLSEADLVLLETVARAVVDASRPLAEQMDALTEQPVRLPSLTFTRSEREAEEATSPLVRPSDLLFDNGYGGFSPDGREYVVYLEPGQWTPAPWINVIANPEFGFLVSEAGGGYSWSLNSGENRLSPWRNDPVVNMPGEMLYLRDEETGRIWSPMPLPSRDDQPYLIRHGAGYTTFEHYSRGLKQRVQTYVAPNAPVKFVRLRLVNVWEHTRRITVTYYVPWVLGIAHETTQDTIVPEIAGEGRGLLARNPYNVEFGGWVAFLTTDHPIHGMTADRREFLGFRGDPRRPAALNRVGLAGRVEAGQDPCAAIQVHVNLAPGEVQEVTFVLGQGRDREEALELLDRYREPGAAEVAWEETRALWEGILGTVTVETPEPAMDVVLNRWLLYQALSCRIWGRSALYQSSGAYGFRDQLQDVMSLIHARPDLAREHILRSARHQFEAGDVLHWWHPPSGRGVRTRISDDLLWLPFVTAYYVESTGDESILHEQLPFVKGPELEPDEEERYDHYPTTEHAASLYTHCLRALDEGSTSGPHDLPLIGTGDWNDGMNRVGDEGEGESVWLAWFLCGTLTRFAEICERMDEPERAERYRKRAEAYHDAVESNAWDGHWYLRGYYDDGTPLGSSENRECQIDAIAQSWSIISGAAKGTARAQEAMSSVARRLVRRDDRLILLFTPPFDTTPHEPGYIKGYLPGIRENGGQYTHAAIWTVWAFAEMGDGDRAVELFNLLNPVTHAVSKVEAERYHVEPYVVVADIYSVPPHTGRGGWTWYTGSSGWLYRLGIEAILGLRRVGDALRIEPSIHKSWEGYTLRYRYGETLYTIQVENPDGVNQGVVEVTLDGETLPDQEIPLRDDGKEHTARVIMG